MAAKYQIRTVVNKEIKDKIAIMCKQTDYSESRMTKVLLKMALNLSPIESVCAFYNIPNTVIESKDAISFNMPLQDVKLSVSEIGRDEFAQAVNELIQQQSDPSKWKVNK